jgi:hypothetical protein
LPRRYITRELTFITRAAYGQVVTITTTKGGQDYPPGYVRWTEGRNLEAFVDLLAEKRLDVRPLISHRFPIDHAPQAYELITGKRQEPFLGVLLTYPDTAVEMVVTRELFTGLVGLPVSGGAQQVLSRAKAAPLGREKLRLGVLGAGNFACGAVPAIQKSPVELVALPRQVD